jgi:hypothetical protein
MTLNFLAVARLAFFAIHSAEFAPACYLRRPISSASASDRRFPRQLNHVGRSGGFVSGSFWLRTKWDNGNLQDPQEKKIRMKNRKV